MDSQTFFENRIAVLATMHKKERVIAPLLDKELGIKVTVPQNFNTDKFGSFTREIERSGSQIEAARLKAQQALLVTGESLAIASEGSFAPHPSLPYIPCNRELVILIDLKNDLEIIGEELSTDTNHNHLKVSNIQQALEFADKVGFPQHGLVVMLNDYPENNEEIIKGINTEAALTEAINSALKKSSNGAVHLETDMRAMYNPTRMKNIGKATLNLIEKINSLCPNCSTPGFDIVQQIPGLPCEWCSAPTTLTKSVIYKCQKCGFRKEKSSPQGKQFAEPAQCIYCNP
ncbi:hypothetical protein Riv7116_0768 [Rivularia sp. PCC 7116]|uniref:DUF6671 family protein n=1 Tax=Rivularia sp. PCC 7116 TaxID=373994 RepID=UPI00029EE9DD|nr:DUF6671 family protein [Rivularia sp. PCC 7116]AFY53355.1 hypothetical protein Riv7116_0768 [Rivularia sp. PCC 7116]